MPGLYYTAACISRPLPNRRARFHSARSLLKGETSAKWHIHPNLSHKIQIEDETLEQSVRGRPIESIHVWKEREDIQFRNPLLNKRAMALETRELS